MSGSAPHSTPTVVAMSLQARLIAVVAMAIVVVASNILVQYPVAASVGGVDLADLLTWGAFSYPVAFLVTDLTNRRFGAGEARRIVATGFVVAVVVSALLGAPRVALASGGAFLAGQLLDVSVFNRLRASSWWRAPFVASILGSVTDTAIFFSLAFAPAFAAVLGASDDFALGSAPFLGVASFEAARWVSWAAADFSVKLAYAVVLLAPYRLVFALIETRAAATAR
jgi:uncharacterized PurR-regulated membrane protein YhhQ (DUF165 family)